MRSSQLITGALAVVATSGLIGSGGPAHASEPTTTRERGIVVECSGTWHGKDVYASLYENNTAGNVIQIVVDGGDVAAGGRDVRYAFRHGRTVFGAMRLGGRRAVIEGTARAVGARTPVHDVYDDAGQHITVDGTHRRLATRLTMTWRRTTLPLDCAGSFVYDLQVTKESTVD
jgi:hypothetical protein